MKDFAIGMMWVLVMFIFTWIALDAGPRMKRMEAKLDNVEKCQQKP